MNKQYLWGDATLLSASAAQLLRAPRFFSTATTARQITIYRAATSTNCKRVGIIRNMNTKSEFECTNYDIRGTKFRVRRLRRSVAKPRMSCRCHYGCMPNY